MDDIAPSIRRCIGVLTLLLTTCASIWFSVPARAQLSVTAPEDRQAHLLQSWYEHHVPQRFRARTHLTICEMTDEDMDAYLKAGESADDANSHSSDDDDDGDIDGLFESDPYRISLRLTADGDPDLFTFAHEFGHYVWFDLLSKEDRQRYDTIYKHQLGAHHLVTRYAATGVEEGFAEAFSFYLVQPVLLGVRDAASLQFLSAWSPANRSKPDAG